jgi:hypothetical protein
MRKSWLQFTTSRRVMARRRRMSRYTTMRQFMLSSCMATTRPYGMSQQTMTRLFMLSQHMMTRRR